MKKGKRSHSVPGEDAGVGDGSDSSGCGTPVYHPQSHLRGDSQQGNTSLCR